MLTILGKKYITDKECSQRFGFSKEWFKKKRYQHLPPPYIKINGKVLYELDVVENWFRSKLNQF